MKDVCRWLLTGGLLLLPAVGGQKYRTWLERARGDASTARLINPYQDQRDAAKAGEKLYHRYCSSCHGADANGLGRNPPLRSLAVINASPGTLYWLLRNGSLSRGMPSWSFLPPAQRWQLISWIDTLKAPAER